MKKLILKSVLFASPFFIFFILTFSLTSKTEAPDLIRMGHIPNIHKKYRVKFASSEKEKLAKLSVSEKGKYKILTIGDSFSEQGAGGYNNYLAQDFSVLHIDQFIYDYKNQIQELVNLCNGDFFDNYHIEYVILQNIERSIIDNIENLDMGGKTLLRDIDSLKSPQINESYLGGPKFFSRTTIEFPLLSMPQYFLSKNYISNKLVYNYELSTNTLFSNFSNKLLFFSRDVKKTKKNNSYENCKKLNVVLNDLSRKLNEKNIKLIFLPSPDKYDFYYDYIAEKNSLPRPLFFEHLNGLEKEYIYIDSKSILSAYLPQTKDLYFFDDTHWSPVSAKIIAAAIKKQIN